MKYKIHNTRTNTYSKMFESYKDAISVVNNISIEEPIELITVGISPITLEELKFHAEYYDDLQFIESAYRANMEPITIAHMLNMDFINVKTINN